MLYFWTTVSASAQGSASRRVECAICGCLFDYRVERKVYESRHCPYMIGAKRAQKAVGALVEKTLSRKLYEDVHPVPCPECGLFQSTMTPIVRDQYLSSLRILSKVLLWTSPILFMIYVLIAGAIADGLGWTNQSKYRAILQVTAPILLALVIPIWLYRFQRKRRNQFDPNSDLSMEQRLAIAKKWSATPASDTE
jgi:hypothetical protein